MRKILYSVLGICVFLLGIAAIGPAFMNWNQYKPLLQDQARTYLGRDLKIEGDIKVVLLPYPSVSIQDIWLSNASAASTPNMVRLKEVSASIGLFALLKRQIVVNHLTFIKLEVGLEKFANGTTNWDFLAKILEQEKPIKHADKMQSESKESYSPSIQLNRIDIRHAKITYREGKSITEIKGLNTQLESHSLQGPFKANGSLIYEQLPLSFKAKIGEFKDSQPLKIQAEIQQGLHKVGFAGQLDRLKMQLNGNLHTLFDGKAVVPFESPLSHLITLESTLEVNPKHILLENLNLTLGEAKAQGRGVLDLEGNQGYQLQLKGLPGSTSLTTKGLLANMNPFQGNFEVMCEDLRLFLKWANVDIKSLSPVLKGKMSLKTSLKASVNQVQLSSLALNLGEHQATGNVNWQGKNLDLNLQTRNLKPWLLLAGMKEAYDLGAVTLKAKLEGDIKHLKFNSQLNLSGGTVNFQGYLRELTEALSYSLDIGIAHTNLNTLFQGLQIDTAFLRLGGSKIAGHLEGNAEKINITSLKASLTPQGSAVTIAGSALVDLSQQRPKVNAILTLGPVIIDHFLPTTSSNAGHSQTNGRGKSFPGAPAHRWSQEQIDFSGLQVADIQLKLQVASLKYKVYYIQPFSLTAELLNGVLSIPTMTGGIFGGQFKSTALVSSQNLPSLQTTVNLKNANLQTLLASSPDLNIRGGQVNMDLRLSSRGKSSQDLVSQLEGYLSLLAEKGAFEGFDLHALAKNLKRAGSVDGLANLFGASMSGGRTLFDTFKTTFKIKNGVARTDDISLVSSAATATGKGFIDLPKWFMDISADIKLVDFPKLPPFKFFLRGPLDTPQHEINKENLVPTFLEMFSGKTINKLLKKATGLSIPGHDDGKEESADLQEHSEKKQNKKDSAIKPEKVLKDVFKGLFK
ncbi:MAG: AsmA family protein [Alphaproteobacteria bacterium]|nr:AsmA family protein [Alphaproteobacteria bacterium]